MTKSKNKTTKIKKKIKKKKPKLVSFHPWLSRELRQSDLPKVFELLAEKLPSEAIQKGQTPYGLNAIGAKEQYITNRFNDVLGNKWHYDFETEDQKDGREVVCKIRIMIGNWKYFEDKITQEISPDNPTQAMVVSTPQGRNEFVWLAIHEHIGGSTNSPLYEARKGAITNAFKKCAAKFGVGREAYEGMDDPDLITNVSIESDDLQPPILDHKTPSSVKVVKEPLPSKEGTENQQDTFSNLMTELNSVHNNETFVKAKEKCTKGKSNLTDGQIDRVADIVTELEKKYK